jgi:hypothetical protein
MFLSLAFSSTRGQDQGRLMPGQYPLIEVAVPACHPMVTRLPPRRAFGKKRRIAFADPRFDQRP